MVADRLHCAFDPQRLELCAAVRRDSGPRRASQLISSPQGLPCQRVGGWEEECPYSLISMSPFILIATVKVD